MPKKTPPRRPGRTRRILWVIAAITASALVAVTIVLVASGKDGQPGPAPSLPRARDSGIIELIGVPALQADCEALERPRYQGHHEVQPGEKHPPYSSDPPSSGWYLVVGPEPAFYNIPPEDEPVMAIPARGGIAVWSSAAEANHVRRFVTLMHAGDLIGVVRPSIKQGVVLSAWGLLQRCKKMSGQLALAFYESFRNKALASIEPTARPASPRS